MTEWQPIETAPKDGTRIIVYWPEYDPKEIEKRYGHTPEDAGDPDSELYDQNGIYVCYFEGATDADVYDETIISNENLDNVEICHGYWRFNIPAIDNCFRGDPYDMDFECGMDGCPPTHWMPLPKILD